MKQHFARVCVGGVAAALTLVGFSGLAATTAVAAPSHAKTAVSGTFSCENGDTGTFVVNNGNAKGTAWSAAHLTFADGSRGIFTPTALDVTVTVNGQVVDTQQVTKHPKRGQVNCTISADLGEGATLAGTVTGKIVHQH